ncbi:hypothetical protein [Salipiger mucosus]|uniref:Uncharacterized protein n=1 Tax=Salipiger mucosus DSM 16094 TaxID=1123237 RepID=S9RPE8_9RHOB|nr:hypothetical protein [Salipiger mucosus]EPX75904.1 hypothetical protein Salmuc_01007 [Salipiger mucosus DSM 16094]
MRTDLNVKGDLNVTHGTKNFRVPHPLDEDSDLVFAALEGPEAGIFLRGGGVLTEGTAVIELPDYFAAIARPEERTVQLTARGRRPFCAEL